MRSSVLLAAVLLAGSGCTPALMVLGQIGGVASVAQEAQYRRQREEQLAAENARQAEANKAAADAQASVDAQPAPGQTCAAGRPVDGELPKECREACTARNDWLLQKCCVDCSAWVSAKCAGRPEEPERKAAFNQCTAHARAQAARREEEARAAAAAEAERQRQAENERAREAAEAAEREKRAEAVRSRLPPERDMTQAAVSAIMCAYERTRAKSLHGIQEERRYSRLGGAVNLSRIYMYQDHARQLDVAFASLRDLLRNEKMKRPPCSTPIVKRLALCHEIQWVDGTLSSDWLEDGDCASEELKPYMETMQRSTGE